MKFTLKGVNIGVTPSLRDYVDKKLVDPIKKLLAEPVRGSLTLDVELVHETRRRKKGDLWEARANLQMPQARVYERSRASELHAAIDDLEVLLKAEIKKQKERLRAKMLRGARQAKKYLHLDRGARLYRQGRIREEGV
ncbi:MAG: ribosome-associated translation inhibitor RaiA [Candidatus Sungbacteria bacterium]|nr:ribosome-associated translation inhibitor RaiA [Candidatus Sungbacteria bacterium]